MEDFKNPALQKLWFEIEAIALGREESEQVADLTLPDNERIEKRAGLLLAQFAEAFELNNLSSASKAKRKN